MKVKRQAVFILGLLMISVFLIYLIFPKSQTIYSFSDINGKTADFFTEAQLKKLECSDAVLALSIGGTLYEKKENINFHIFSKNDYSLFEPKSFIVSYDGESKKIETNVQYKVNTNNPNFEREKEYEFEGKNIHGFEKEVYGGFENFDYCLIDFNRMFYQHHKKEHDKFNVKIIVKYCLDKKEYEQELNYSVECLKIPYNFFTYLFAKIFSGKYSSR